MTGDVEYLECVQRQVEMELWRCRSRRGARRAVNAANRAGISMMEMMRILDTFDFEVKIDDEYCTPLQVALWMRRHEKTLGEALGVYPEHFKRFGTKNIMALKYLADHYWVHGRYWHEREDDKMPSKYDLEDVLDVGAIVMQLVPDLVAKRVLWFWF
jgi:hypothetical protein